MKIGDLVVWRSPDPLFGGAKLGLIVEEEQYETVVIIKLVSGEQRVVKKNQLRKADEDR